MNDVVKQVRFHAKRCEHYTTLAAQLLETAVYAQDFGLDEFPIRSRIVTCNALSGYHALKAFELSLQAARYV